MINEQSNAVRCICKNVFVFENALRNVLKNVLGNVLKNVLRNIFKNILRNVLKIPIAPIVALTSNF